GVELSSPADPSLEMAATLAYRVSPLSYRQTVEKLACRPASDLEAFADLAFAHRGSHDEPVRETRVGYQLIFDLCLDNGAFRDLHRHRNCVQIMKDFTAVYGYDTPEALGEAAQEASYREAMDRAGGLAERLGEEKAGL